MLSWWNQWLTRMFDRSFLTRAYPTMKKNNPHIPILVREAQGTEPRIFARYGMAIPSWDMASLLGSVRLNWVETGTDVQAAYGKEKSESLKGMLNTRDVIIYVWTDGMVQVFRTRRLRIRLLGWSSRNRLVKHCIYKCNNTDESRRFKQQLCSIFYCRVWIPYLGIQTFGQMTRFITV